MKLKRCILFILLFFTCTICFAEDDYQAGDEIYLNESTENQINIKKQQKINSKKYNLNKSDDFRISPQNIDKYQNFNPYSTKSTSYTQEKKHGNFSLGTKYESSFSPNSYSQTNTLFTKYQKNKFSLNTSYKNNTLTSFDQQNKGTFAFSPEYKLNNHVSLQNIYSTNFLDKNRKNEFVFSLTPFKDDRMNFNVGASQIYSENSAPTRSQLNFSTKFKF